jgi:hypothetical protein
MLSHTMERTKRKYDGRSLTEHSLDDVYPVITQRLKSLLIFVRSVHFISNKGVIG